jgi:hypothetical protein
VTAQVSRFERTFAPGEVVYLWWRAADEMRFSE